MSTHEVKSTVSKVTVYTDRAMVTRLAKATLDKKTLSLNITHLPANLDKESLRISARGTVGLTLLDFKVSDQQYKDVPEAALHTLGEEKQRLLDNIAAFKDEIAAIEHQKAFLKEIGVGKSKQISKDLDVQRPVLDDWKSVLEFLGKEQRDLDGLRRDLELKIRKAEADVRLIDAELMKFSGATTKVRKIVTIAVEVQDAGDFEFELSYIIHDAKWQPLYDARVDSKAKKVGIRYYGMVTQRTGEDWKGVEVLLSTARPQLGGNAPAIGAWYVSQQVMREEREMAVSRGGGGFAGGLKKSMAMPASEAAPGMPAMEEAADESYATVEAGQGSSVVFRTGGRGDVPGDGGEAKLLIMDGDFGNQFQYLTVPKLAEHVYLTAEVTNTTDFPLLPGKISIFLDGNFVGSSRMQALVVPGEKFELHLGVDESIKVVRKLQKRVGDEKGLFSRSHIEDFSYLITLESNRDSAEQIIVRDHLPVTTDEKIKVETKVCSPVENPEKDKDKLANGVVEWKINLQPRSKEKIELGFSVAYPKDMSVSGL
ncbi:MAG: mucoidy inhibitor MuiA family protein [Bacteroidetes bacterium]|nr:mucoidy inhibitor MuiA family protein [Bacteroidota bacterium]